MASSRTDAPRKHQGLLDIAGAIVFGDNEGAGIRRLLTGDQPEEGGLAVAVAADEPQPFAGIESEAQLVEQGSAAVALADVFRSNHGGVSSRICNRF